MNEVFVLILALSYIFNKCKKILDLGKKIFFKFSFLKIGLQKWQN